MKESFSICPTPPPAYQASKWLKVPIFLTKNELSSLFHILEGYKLYGLGKIIGEEDLATDLSSFALEYQNYLQAFFQREVVKPLSSYALTADLKDLYLSEVAPGRFIIRIKSPVIQMTPHFFCYSSVDATFRSNVFGENKIFWGLQFSFPQVYQDNQLQVVETKGNANFSAFSLIRKWVRDFSSPTPFLVEGKKIISPIRIGKEMKEQIHRYPPLLQANIGVGV